MPRKDDPKSFWLHLRLDAAQRAALEGRAQTEGRTMAELARGALAAALGDPGLETEDKAHELSTAEG